MEFKEYIHYDKRMEQAVLGACLLEKDSVGRIRGLLTKECFYVDGNKEMFEVLIEMWENNYPIDLLTVTQYLIKKKGRISIEGVNVPYYLVKMTKDIYSTANIEYHSLILRQLYVERELLRIQSKTFEGDVLQKTEKLRDELFKLSQIKVVNDWKDMVDVVMELHKHMDEVLDKDIIGVPTGFSKFDMVTGGLVKGDMIVLAARPSVGKSAFLGAVAVNAAENGFKARIISLEMSNIQIGARLGSLVSDIEFYKIFRNRMDDDKQRDELYSKLEKLSNLDIKISDKTKVNINDIRAKVGQLKSKDDIDILFVDYLQLLDSEEGFGKNFNREQEVSKMSRGFKLMAKEFNIPIVVLAQLNRESEKSQNKKPALHHLRESGAIEQDADLVVFLHRDWKVGIQFDKDGNSTEFEADLIIAKGRNIETPEIKIGFDGAKMRFYDKDKIIYSSNSIPNNGNPF